MVSHVKNQNQPRSGPRTTSTWTREGKGKGREETHFGMIVFLFRRRRPCPHWSPEYSSGPGTVIARMVSHLQDPLVGEREAELLQVGSERDSLATTAWGGRLVPPKRAALLGALRLSPESGAGAVSPSARTARPRRKGAPLRACGPCLPLGVALPWR